MQGIPEHYIRKKAKADKKYFSFQIVICAGKLKIQPYLRSPGLHLVPYL